MNKSILCYVGSLNPQDGVDYLLRSLRHLLHDLKRSDFDCVIMGSGDSLQDLRDLAGNLQLNGCVELTGFISDEDLQANLAAAVERRIHLDQGHGIHGVGKADRLFRSERNPIFC